MSARFRKISLALSLIASLLAGHASATCICSHHQLQESEKADCHSHHHDDEAANSVVPGTSDTAVDTGCVCLIEPSTPSASARSAKKDFPSTDLAGTNAHIASALKPIEVAKLTGSLPGFENDLSHSRTARTLLPSRAPPRL